MQSHEEQRLETWWLRGRVITSRHAAPKESSEETLGVVECPQVEKLRGD